MEELEYDFDVETLLMQEDILLAPAPTVEFIMFDVTPMVTEHNPNCMTYLQNMLKVLGPGHLVFMDQQALVNAITQCQNLILEELERIGSQELTDKLCRAVLERHSIVLTHYHQNADTYNRYLQAVQNEPCELYQDTYSVQQRLYATLYDAEKHLRNYLIFVLDEICKLSQPKKRKKGEHAKVLPKEATTVLWQWFTTNYKNPYPNDTEKKFLSQQTGLTVQQIANWMDNHRRRYPEWKQGKPPTDGLRLRDEHVEIETLPSITGLTLDDEISAALEDKSNEITTEEQPEVVDGPSKDEARSIRAHTLLMKLGTKQMLDMTETEFNEIVMAFRGAVINEYEKVNVISEDRAMDYWREATLTKFKNGLLYDQELEESDTTNTAYSNLIQRNKDTQKELWENLIM